MLLARLSLPLLGLMRLTQLYGWSAMVEHRQFAPSLPKLLIHTSFPISLLHADRMRTMTMVLTAPVRPIRIRYQTSE